MEERRGGRNSRRMVVEMFVLGTIASLVGIAVGLAIDWFPEEASTQAGPIDRLWDVLVIVSVPVFVGVTIVVLYAARLFRERPGEEGLDGPPIHGNTKLEVIWTTIPALILLALCTYAYVVLLEIEETPARAQKELRVAVKGEQFAWTFTYAGADGKPITTMRLYLAKDRPVKFDVQAKDVIHDFWVPAFRMKIDAVPGVTTSIRVTPSRLGTYPVVCAELCGLGHAYMRSEAEVMEPAAFDAWMEKKSAEAGAPAGGGDDDGAGGTTAPVDGKAIFTAGTDSGGISCAACHQLADAGTPEGIGPNLDEVLPGQSAEEITASIVDPEAKISPGKPAGVMPAMYGDTLSPAEIEAIVTYLSDSTKK